MISAWAAVAASKVAAAINIEFLYHFFLVFRDLLPPPSGHLFDHAKDLSA